MARGSNGGWPLWAISVAGLAGALGVGLGAWAAHGAGGLFGSRAAELVRTALPWHMWHVLALLAVALWRQLDGGGPPRVLAAAALLFFAGLLLFCGSLYASAFGLHFVPQGLAPIGGLALIGGWLAVALAAALRLR